MLQCNFKFLQKIVVNANAKPSKQLRQRPPNVIVDMRMPNTKVKLKFVYIIFVYIDQLFVYTFSFSKFFPFPGFEDDEADGAAAE